MAWELPEADQAREIVHTFLPVREANGIIKFIHHPCAAPWFLYVEALIPAFFELWIFFLTEEADDVAKNWIERQTKHIARDGRRVRKKVKPKWWDGANRALWIVDDAFDRGQLAWAVVALGVEGAYRWTTIIEQSAYCTGGGLFHSEVGNVAFPCGPAWNGVPVNHLVQNTNNWPWTSLTVSPGAGPTFAMIYMEPYFSNAFNWGTNFQLRIGIQSGLGTEWRETEPIQLKIGEPTPVTASIDWYNHPAAPATVVWAWRYDGGAIPLINHGPVDVFVGQTLPNP
jgi:hypothetical protein